MLEKVVTNFSKDVIEKKLKAAIQFLTKMLTVTMSNMQDLQPILENGHVIML